MFINYKSIKSLSKTDQKLYNYMTSHMNEVVHMSVRNFAKVNYVSTATVLRFCRAMNCEGFSDLKRELINYNSQIPDAKEINSELISFLNWANTDSFNEKIDLFTSFILSSGTVFFIGIGNSGAMARYGARYFTNVGLFSFAIDDAFYPYELNGKDYCVIVFSESGETIEVINQVKHYKEEGATILLITNNESSTLASMSDAVISYQVTHARLLSTYNLTTQVPAVYIIERLGMKIRNTLIDEKETEAEN